jgi:4-hydroxybenzoate polyprenyltransferase
MIKVLDYIFAARPMLHLPVWSVYLVSLHAVGREFRWQDLALLASLSLLVAGAYYVNQVYDQESDRLNRKLGFLQRGYASPQSFMLGFILLSITGLAVGAFVAPVKLIILLQHFVLAWIYSGPPLRLKDRPWLGLLANAWAYGFLIPLVATGLRSGDFFAFVNWALPVYFFAAVAATHVMTTLPDAEGDRAVGKRTVAVILPPGFCKLIAAGLLVIAAAVALHAQQAALTYLAVFSIAIVLVSLLMPLPRIELAAAKMPLLLLTLLAGFWYPFYLLFIVALVLATRIYYLRRFQMIYPGLA